MKHKEYQQKRAALDDAYLFGEITLSDYARDSKCKSSGTLIQCPRCTKTQKVYHLNWSALKCMSCSWDSKKMEWLIESRI